MNIEVKSSNGISLVPIETRLLSRKRYIFIEDEITQESSCDFAKKLMLLVLEDKTKPIWLFINSPGGDVSAGLLIYDMIQSCTTPIITVCLGQALSMGAILFASGKHGRIMLPNSELMLHQPLLGNKVGGNVSSIKALSDSMLETRKKINEILSKHTCQPLEEIEKATEYDHYFNADESISFGLADKILGLAEIMEGNYEN